MKEIRFNGLNRTEVEIGSNNQATRNDISFTKAYIIYGSPFLPDILMNFAEFMVLIYIHQILEGLKPPIVIPLAVVYTGILAIQIGTVLTAPYWFPKINWRPLQEYDTSLTGTSKKNSLHFPENVLSQLALDDRSTSRRTRFYTILGIICEGYLAIKYALSLNQVLNTIEAPINLLTRYNLWNPKETVTTALFPLDVCVLSVHAFASLLLIIHEFLSPTADMGFFTKRFEPISSFVWSLILLRIRIQHTENEIEHWSKICRWSPIIASVLLLVRIFESCRIFDHRTNCHLVQHGRMSYLRSRPTFLILVALVTIIVLVSVGGPFERRFFWGMLYIASFALVLDIVLNGYYMVKEFEHTAHDIDHLLTKKSVMETLATTTANSARYPNNSIEMV